MIYFIAYLLLITVKTLYIFQYHEIHSAFILSDFLAEFFLASFFPTLCMVFSCMEFSAWHSLHGILKKDYTIAFKVILLVVYLVVILLVVFQVECVLPPYIPIVL